MATQLGGTISSGIGATAARLAERSPRYTDALAPYARGIARLRSGRAKGRAGSDAAEAPCAMTRLLGGMKAAQTLRSAMLPAPCLDATNWTMITELMLAGLEGRRMAVSSLGTLAGIPYTTALNHIRILSEVGIFRRIPDRFDRRRTYVELNPAVAEQVQAYLQRIIAAE